MSNYTIRRADARGRRYERLKAATDGKDPSRARDPPRTATSRRGRRHGGSDRASRGTGRAGRRGAWPRSEDVSDASDPDGSLLSYFEERVVAEEHHLHLQFCLFCVERGAV